MAQRHPMEGKTEKTDREISRLIFLERGKGSWFWNVKRWFAETIEKFCVTNKQVNSDSTYSRQ